MSRETGINIPPQVGAVEKDFIRAQKSYRIIAAECLCDWKTEKFPNLIQWARRAKILRLHPDCPMHECVSGTIRLKPGIWRRICDPTKM